jgi:hypothetical protein
VGGELFTCRSGDELIFSTFLDGVATAAGASVSIGFSETRIVRISRRFGSAVCR